MDLKKYKLAEVYAFNRSFNFNPRVQHSTLCSISCTRCVLNYVCMYVSMHKHSRYTVEPIYNRHYKTRYLWSFSAVCVRNIEVFLFQRFKMYW